MNSKEKDYKRKKKGKTFISGYFNKQKNKATINNKLKNLVRVKKVR